MKLRHIAIVLLAFSTLTVSYAQNCLPSSKEICLSKVGDFINNLNTMVVVALGVLFLAAAVVGFFFGVVRFIWAQQQGDEKGVTNGKETLKWGLIALFCAFSVYGIIQFAQSTLFPGTDLGNIKIPKLIIDTTSTASPGQSNGPNGPGQSNGPTGSNYTPSPSGPGGSTYVGPGANTGGQRTATGRCTKTVYGTDYNGSYVDGDCIPDVSSPVGGSTSFVSTCGNFDLNKTCGNGRVCKNTQNGMACVSASIGAVVKDCNSSTFELDCNDGNGAGTCKSSSIGYRCVPNLNTVDIPTAKESVPAEDPCYVNGRYTC